MTPRIVSLLPAATEWVCALGQAAALVGVSHECDYPANLNLPVLTRSRLPEEADSSRGIDEAMAKLLRQTLSIYEIDVAALCALSPDIVLTQNLCSICAVSAAEVQATLSQLSQKPVQVLSLSPKRLVDILDHAVTIGEALGQPERGLALREELRERIDVVRFFGEGAASPPNVLAIEWLEPVMVAGLWMPELIRIAGGYPLGSDAGQPAQTLNLAALSGLAPDLVLLKPCGFRLEQTLSERSILPSILPWKEWPCVTRGRVYVADGNAYFNRPGPRIVDSLELLAACLHPASFAEHQNRYGAAARRLHADLSIHPISDPLPSLEIKLGTA